MLRALLGLLAATGAYAAGVRVLNSTTLGTDPDTVNRLNGESFQQDAIITFQGWQYAVHYLTDAANASVRHPAVSRRKLAVGDWETLTLEDYDQTEDDGHDVISIGISKGDGTIHLGYDQHDNDMNYRVSSGGAATDPESTTWDASIFGPTLDHLPGLESLDKSIYFINVTYPRFLMIPTSVQSASGSDLIMEFRVGRSGLGDDWLYRYTPGQNWTLIGRYLEGVNNNAYINGLDFDSLGRLHTTWTYRDYVNDTGQDVAVQAGPNGPENNHDLDYALSTDLGATWVNNWNQTIANMSADQPIVPASAGITIFGIPKYGGILNQEAQTIDGEGRMHVLNRENTTGTERWYHYWKSTVWHWTRTPLPLPEDLPSALNITGTPTVIGKRGKIVSHPPSNSILLLLPDNAPGATGLSILRASAAGHFRDWEVVWEASSGCTGEVLFDRYRVDTNQGGDGVLSLYVVNGTDVSVVDLDLSGL